MEKTIEQWFQELPEPYKTLAITNAAKQSTLNFNKEDVNCNKLSDAIAIGFLWQETLEGESYWEEVYDTLKADEFKEYRREDWEWEAEQENRTGLED